MNKLILDNKTVLVLGWEFPPHMVGGLAVATYGIVEALREHIHVILILPHKNKQTPHLDNVTIYGLNEIEKYFPNRRVIELMRSMRQYISTSEEVHFYPNILAHNSKETFTRNSSQATHESTRTSYSLFDAFQSEEVYGWSLWKKLDAYVEVVSLLCEYIEFDIVHSHDWLTYRAGIQIKEKFDKPLFIHVHALETDRVGPHVNNEIFQLEKKAIETADVVMPVSEYTKKQLRRYYINYPDKIVPIHNAVEKEKVQRWKHRIPEKIVTFLGRITAQKGPEYLLETISKVVKKYPKVKFVVAGKGDMLAPLISSSAYSGLSRYIVFAGFLKRSEVNALLSTSDVYFMPSVSEPFGLTALEAAHYQVPCVITKQSGVAEVLTAALKADYWDTNLFAQHIIDLLKDEKLSEQIVGQSNDDLKKISWHNSANKIAIEYNKIIRN